MNIKESPIDTMNCFEEIREAAGDDPKLLKEILEVFIKSSRNDLNRLYNALNDRDASECRKVSHKLRSTYGYFSKSGVQEVMASIEENMSSDKNFHNMELVLSQLYPLLKKIDEDVDHFLYHQEVQLSKNILIIEDDELIAKVLRSKLENENYAVDHAANGLDGLDLMTQRKYEVVITDVNMPFVSGLEVVNFVKNKLVYNTKLVVVSASKINSEIENAMDMSVDRFLSKPLNPKDVFELINELTENNETLKKAA